MLFGWAARRVFLLSSLLRLGLSRVSFGFCAILWGPTSHKLDNLNNCYECFNMMGLACHFMC